MIIAAFVFIQPTVNIYAIDECASTFLFRWCIEIRSWLFSQPSTLATLPSKYCSRIEFDEVPEAAPEVATHFLGHC